MILLKEINMMSSRHNRGAHSFTTTLQDLEADGMFLADVDVEVTFNYEGESSTLHVYDDPTTREYHGADVEIVSVILTADAHAYDEDGDKLLKTFPKGMNAAELPGYTEKTDEMLIDEAHEHMGGGDDYDPRDDYDRDYR